MRTESDKPLVIVVDDHEDCRDIYGLFLEGAGFRVARAASGEEALAIVATEKPDAVVMDLRMPGIAGWEATRIIKSNPQTKDVAVIALTAFSLPDDVGRALAAGADEVCTKPCPVEELEAAIRRHITQRR